jgi:hypothetical protein
MATTTTMNAAIPCSGSVNSNASPRAKLIAPGITNLDPNRISRARKKRMNFAAPPGLPLKYSATRCSSASVALSRACRSIAASIDTVNEPMDTYGRYSSKRLSAVRSISVAAS